jgi:hypothetical protein
LLPVGASTRLVDYVDFVPVSGRGLDLVATTFREEGDVHCFVDGTLRAWFEVILWLWVIVDHQPVTDVISPTTVRSNGCYVSESFVEQCLDQVTIRPEEMDLAPLAMDVGSTGSRATLPDAPLTEGGHHVDNDLGNCLVVGGIEDSKPGTLVLRRHRLPPLDVGCPAVVYRLVSSASNRQPTDFHDLFGN